MAIIWDEQRTKTLANAAWNAAIGCFVVVPWTPRDGGRPIILTSYGHEQEEERFRQHLD
jgi:hypothetical protein